MIHVFRLAEGLGASILFVGTTPSGVPGAIMQLDTMFEKWRTVHWQSCNTVSEMLAIFNNNKLRPVALEITDRAVPYSQFSLARMESLALIIGNEETGIAPEALAAVHDHVYIPMVGTASCFAAGMALAIVASHFAYVSD